MAERPAGVVGFIFLGLGEPLGETAFGGTGKAFFRGILWSFSTRKREGTTIAFVRLRRGREGSGTGVAREEFMIGLACGVTSAFSWVFDILSLVTKVELYESVDCKPFGSSIVFDGSKMSRKVRNWY
jgi:hypothetical protein